LSLKQIDEEIEEKSESSNGDNVDDYFRDDNDRDEEENKRIMQTNEEDTSIGSLGARNQEE
jgi:hypothetical protein